MNGLGLEGFEEIFGEARPAASMPNRRILFRVYASDPRHLTTCVTDFQSNTWQAIQSLEQLHDLRDDIGIGGTWLEFLDYLTCSFKSDDVKIVSREMPKSNGSVSAKLVGQKAKGMPLVSVTLSKLPDNDAVDAIAKFSVQLFETYKCMKESIAKDGESSFQLKKVNSEGQNDDARTLELHSHQQRKYKIGGGNERSVSFSTSGLEMSPEKAPTRNKVTNTVVPAYRRAKKRGAILQDNEEAQED